MHIILELPGHIPNQPTRRDIHNDLDPTLLVSVVADHLPLPHRKFLHYTSCVLLLHEHRALLDRLKHPSLGRARIGIWNHNGLGRANAELEALPAERLEEHAKVQHAAPAQLERLGRRAWQDGQRDVRLGLFVNPVSNHLRRELGAFLPCERGVVRVHEDGDCGGVDRG